MVENVLTTIMVMCGILTIVSLYMIYRERKVLNSSINNLIIPKNQYVKMVVEWCHNNLKNPNTKKPTVTVKYNQNKKVHGVYDPSTHCILIYINTHNTIRELTNTVIHEYIHARQKDRAFNRLYKEHNNTVGYWNNPFEIESRKISKKKEEECIKYITSNYKVLQ
jgi:beta-lactamase regulating signal transducer with metallopeptidase domain